MAGRRSRLLFLATNPREGASTRYRVLQYFSLLEQNGFECLFQPFFSSQAIGTLYQPGRILRKFLYFLEGCTRRYLALLALKNRVDLLFIHRELFPLGIPFFLKKVRHLRIPTIYDYDDAMFLPQRQDRWLLSLLERPATVDELIRRSTCVIAGNAFLANYALRLNPHTATIPTPVNTEVFSVKNSHGTSDKCIIGWIGSHSTAKYLRVLSPVLEQLAHTHRFTLKVVGAGNPLRIPGVEVISLPWSLQREPEEFRTCDIGVYPLRDDEWAKGKCGFKAIQFMACGVPVVASAVGVNAEIIEDSITGFLARSEDEWVEKLSLLIQDAPLRQKLGLAGRQVVEERFSLRANEGKFLAAIEAAVGQQTKS